MFYQHMNFSEINCSYERTRSHYKNFILKQKFSYEIPNYIQMLCSSKFYIQILSIDSFVPEGLQLDQILKQFWLNFVFWKNTKKLQVTNYYNFSNQFAKENRKIRLHTRFRRAVGKTNLKTCEVFICKRTSTFVSAV